MTGIADNADKADDADDADDDHGVVLMMIYVIFSQIPLKIWH